VLYYYHYYRHHHHPVCEFILEALRLFIAYNEAWAREQRVSTIAGDKGTTSAQPYTNADPYCTVAANAATAHPGVHPYTGDRIVADAEAPAVSEAWVANSFSDKKIRLAFIRKVTHYICRFFSRFAPAL